MTITFTRYLYNLDEVKLSFIEALLKKENIDECYFWIYEIYESGFVRETWNLLYKIFYDFFGTKNYKMEMKIKMKHSKWKKDNKLEHIIWVVKNLFRFTSNYNVFILRTYYFNKNIEIVKNNEILLKNITITEKKLVNAIKQKKTIAIAYYLHKLKDKSDIIELCNKVTQKTFIMNKYYSNLYHQLLVFILKNLKIEKKKKIIYKKVADNEILKLMKTNESCKNMGKYNDISYIYKTLKIRRLYGTSKNIGCFKLNRENIDLNHKFWYHWEYFAYKSPIWKKRFDKYSININNEKELIEFKNDKEEEMFYEEFGYEPDEQEKNIQEKSTGEIKSQNIKNWLMLFYNKSNLKRIGKKILY